MLSQTSKHRAEALLAICLITAGILGVAIYWVPKRLDRSVHRELYAIHMTLLEYVTANNDLYPPSLEFLDEVKYRKLLAGSLHCVKLSRVQYVWPGEQPYGFGGHRFLEDQNTVDCLKQVYGDFGFSTGVLTLPTRRGMPIDHVILLAYEKRSACGKDWTYVHFVSGNYGKYPSEDIQNRIVLQNAYFRLPVDVSDADILRKALNDEKSNFRFRSAEALAKLGFPEGREFLEEAFKSSDIFQKTKAADSLARLGDDEAIVFLNNVYETSDDECLKDFVKTTLDEIMTE